MKKYYRMAEETIDENDLEILIDWLKGNPWLTQGALVKEFEQRWAKWLGVPFALFVNSGSSANLLMYYALLMSNKLRNKKVIVPAVCWPTTVAPAIQLGFEPILCEADRATLGLDPNYLEDLLKRHHPAVVTVCHVLGVPADLEAIMNLKDRYDFFLLEDACAATGSRYDGQLVGSFGDVSTFSFFFGHHISTIEGGMVCCKNEYLHDILLQVRSHGWAKDIESKKEEEKAKQAGVIPFNRPFTFYYPGFNCRSTDLNAKVGLCQLDKIESVIEQRVKNHLVYQSRFQGDSGFVCQSNLRATICSIAFLGIASSVEHRQRIAEALKRNNIETRPYGGGNMSRQPFWADRYPEVPLRIADRVEQTAFQLPNHGKLTQEDVHFICDVVLSIKK